jgi:hypothetical protein
MAATCRPGLQMSRNESEAGAGLFLRNRSQWGQLLRERCGQLSEAHAEGGN